MTSNPFESFQKAREAAEEAGYRSRRAIEDLVASKETAPELEKPPTGTRQIREQRARERSTWLREQLRGSLGGK